MRIIQISPRPEAALLLPRALLPALNHTLPRCVSNEKLSFIPTLFGQACVGRHIWRDGRASCRFWSCRVSPPQKPIYPVRIQTSGQKILPSSVVEGRAPGNLYHLRGGHSEG